MRRRFTTAAAFWPRRPVVCLLLLLAVLPLFFSAPTPHSQTLTTITSLQTVTTESTVITARAVTSYMTKTTVLTEFTTATSYYPKARVVYKSSFLLETAPYDPRGFRYGCLYYDYAFTAKKNEVLDVNLTSTRQIAFFVMSDEAFNAWIAKGFCEAEDALDEAQQVQEHSQRLVVPNDGKYHLVLENWSHENAAWIDIVVQLTGLLSESTSVITTSTVLTSRSTITETYPTTMTEVLTKTSPVTQIGIVNTLFLSVSGGVLILIALAVLVPVTYMVGRRKRKLVSHPKKETYVEFLAKLEELRSRGDISEETYLKLKEEYWKKFGK